MNRLWACSVALLAAGLVATAAQATTIEVNTFGESGDGDDLCSLREAVASSHRATLVSARTNNRNQFVTDKETLDRNLNRLRLNPLEHYPRNDLVDLLVELREDLEAHDPATPADEAARDEILDFLGDSSSGFINDVENMPDNKVYYTQVIIARDLIEDVGDIDTDPHAGSTVEAPPIGSNDVLSLIDTELDRLKELNDADGCDNGTSFDTILLEEGTYTLEDGEINVDTRVTIQGVGDETIIEADAGSRLFSVPDQYVVELKLLHLTGGNPATGNGGAVYVEGSLTLTDVLITGCAAANGGAVFVMGSPLEEVSGGSLDMERVRLYGNTATGNGGAVAVEGQSVKGTDVTLGRINPDTLADEGNVAGGLGGGLYVDPQKEGGTVIIERGSLVTNAAAGGAALHVAGTDTATVLINVTIARNDASARAAVEIVTDGDGALSINNLSLLENTAVTGTGGLYVATLDEEVVIANSVISDNTGTVAQDCDLPAGVDDDNINRNYFDDGSDCPGLRYSTMTPLNTNFELASGSAIGFLVSALDPEAGLYIPIYPDDAFDIRLVNRGAGILEEFRCVEQDQRNLARTSVFDEDCDIGAVEYQTGRPVDDEIVLDVNEAACIEVIGNDVGDSDYDVGTLAVIAVERAGATAVVVPTASCPNAADMDATYPEAILFTPARGFVGETNVTYSLSWLTQGTVPASGNLSAIAHVSTEPASGIKSSSLGHFGLGTLGLTALLVLRRRTRITLAMVAGAMTLALTASATDNIIYVNTGIDNTVISDMYGDDVCSLREALETASNDQENRTDGDCLSGNEGPDVIEVLVPQITLAGQLTSPGGVTIRCHTEDEDTDEPCVISGNGTFRLINGLGSIAIDRMILENGNAGTGSGGAIFAEGGITVSNSIIRGNQAARGGALFLNYVRGALTITNSLFRNNTSTGVGGGGVASMSANADHKISISSSTFAGNTATGGGPAVFDINTTSSAVIVNSVFSGNSSTLGSGAMDTAGANSSVTMRNLTVVGNTSAPGFAAVSFGTTSNNLLVNSIVSNNGDGAGNANCAGTYTSGYNLYGEATGTVTCVLPVTNNTNLQRDPALVFDGVGPDDLLPLDFPVDLDDRTLDADGFIPPHHEFTDPLSVDNIMVDAGYADSDPDTSVEEDLVTPLDITSTHCADVDMRGESRASGARCDIGAYEWVQVSALDDEGSNVNRRDRYAVIDILANDLVEDGERCVPDDTEVVAVLPAGWQEARLLQTTPPVVCAAVLFETARGTAFFREVIDDPTEDEPERRIVDDEDLRFEDDEYEYEIDSDSEFVLIYQSAGDALILEAAPRTLDYVARDVAGNVSEVGKIEVSVLNVPPDVDNDEVRVKQGQTAVVDVLANDRDWDAGMGETSDDVGAVPPVLSDSGLNVASLSITGSNCRAVRQADTDPPSGIDEDDDVTYYQCQFGKAYIDPVTGVITFIPDNKYNAFTEIFTYEVSDYAVKLVVGGPDTDESVSSSGTVTIRVGRPSANGGSILGEDDLSDMLGIDFLGAAGNLFLLVLGATALRRRRFGATRS